MSLSPLRVTVASQNEPSEEPAGSVNSTRQPFTAAPLLLEIVNFPW